MCLDKNGTILGNAKELNALSVLYSSHYQLLPKALKSSGSSGEEEMSDIIRERERESSYFIALPSLTPDDDVVKFLLLSPTFFVHGGGDIVKTVMVFFIS